MVYGGDAVQRFAGQFFALVFDQPGEHLLHEAREAGHVGVIKEIGAVLQLFVVRDGEADFMQVAGVGKQRRKARRRVFRQLGIERQRQGFDLGGLFAVDGKAAHEAADGGVAFVAAVAASHEVEDDAFAQRFLRDEGVLDAEMFKQSGKDAYAAGKTKGARRVNIQAGGQTVGVADVDELFEEMLKLCGADAAGFVQQFFDRFGGAGGEDDGIPVRLAEVVDVRLDHLPDVFERFFNRLAGDFAFGKEALAHVGTAHFQRTQKLRRFAVAEDDFGGTAADVDDEIVVFVMVVRGDAEIDEARFFFAGDDFNRHAEHGFTGTQKIAAVLRGTQGLRGNDAEVFARNMAQAFGHLRQGFESARHAGGIQRAVFIQPFA